MRLRFAAAATVALLLTILVALRPAQAQQLVHRNGFAGKDPYWVRGDANIHFEEKAQKITDTAARNATTSEYIKIEANPAPGATDAEFVHYYYATPPSPVGPDTVARVWVKSFHTGVQLKARIVLPKEKDPKNPDAPLTTLIVGDICTKARTWQQLTMGDVQDSLAKHKPVLVAKLNRPVDITGAYIDSMVLNVYAGPGVTEVWIDDLEISPVLKQQEPKDGPGKPGKTVSNPKRKPPLIEFSNGDLLVDQQEGEGPKPFFMRAVRHTNTPLWALDVARFNTIWFPGEVTDEVYEEAIRAKFFIVPSLPLPATDWDPARPNQGDQAVLDKDAELVGKHLKRFLSSDAVLMWDLGSGRTTEQLRRVARVADVVKMYDPRKPRAVDLWDGHNAYSNYVDAIGAHRWPLFTSLDLTRYAEWLAQRKALTSPGKLMWTWIQTHLPEWLIKLQTGDANTEKFADPIGPHPEQIRVLTYLALAAGYRGIGYWSDQFLADSHHGRDRLLEIAMLNAEMELLEPVLLSANEPVKWLPTSHPSVRVAILRGPKEVIALPIWLGKDTQYCPEQGTLASLTLKVPTVPDGATPWRITAAGVDEIKDVKSVVGGTEITINEFDTAAAIVFTSDLGPTGKVVRWQDNTRHKLARTAANWAREQAVAQFNKTLITHKNILTAGGPDVREAADLLKESTCAIDRASLYTDNAQPDMAYREARRALRPLRVLQRQHWLNATEKLDTPTASPFAVSFYLLPKHWELTRYIQQTRPGGNSLLHPGFELNEKVAEEGAAVSSLPGWTTRRTFLDPVIGVAAIVNSDAELVEDAIPKPLTYGKDRFGQPGRPVPTMTDALNQQPRPNLGRHCLKLAISPDEVKLGIGKVPQALERSFLAVDSPAAEFPAGTWVRISFWTKVLEMRSSADGVMIYDSAGGEPLSVRPNVGPRWQQFHLYRQVPESGKIGITFALTGLGLAFFDDVKIEPMIPFGGSTSAKPVAPGSPPKPRSTEEDKRTLPFPRQTDPLPPPRPVLPKQGVRSIPQLGEKR